MGFDMNSVKRLTRPPYLEAGDAIGLVAPARYISEAELRPAIDILTSWGYKVIRGRNLLGRHHQFSGTDAARASDMQAMIDNPEVRAILCARGGYGTARMIDLVDWQGLRNDPRWVIGYSDVTALHAHLQQQLGLESLHATMPLNFPEEGVAEALESLRQALNGSLKAYELDAQVMNRPGHCRGLLTGGNLSVLYSILGSHSELTFEGKVLFLEDLDEYLYHIDRMMLNLKRSGRLDGIIGLIAGGFTQMRDNQVPYGKTAEEIVLEHVNHLNIPMVFGFPAGHVARNLALYLGREVSLEAGDRVRLTFEVGH